MNREGLHRIIRVAAAMLGEDTVVIICSQSILASFGEFMLPDDATMSAEADLLPFDDDDETKADSVDGLLGEASHFYDKYGVYADGVSPWTANLPASWDERLVRIEDPESGAVGLCLHPEDLCVAKVVAGRAKDIRFLTAVFEAGLVDPDAVVRRLTTVALRGSEAEVLRRRGLSRRRAARLLPFHGAKPLARPRRRRSTQSGDLRGKIAAKSTFRPSSVEFSCASDLQSTAVGVDSRKHCDGQDTKPIRRWRGNASCAQSGIDQCRQS